MSHDLKQLTAEAHELGIHYTGDDPEELLTFIAMARAERGAEHPVPCYGLSYDPTDRRCRICQLRGACADLDTRPRIDVLEVSLQPIPCDVCKAGMLEVELEDPDTGHLRDFGCSRKGCPNTVSIQCGWESHGANAIRGIVLGEPDPDVIDVEAGAVESSDSAEEKESAAPSSGESATAEGVSTTPATPGKKVKLVVVKGGKAEKPAKAPVKKKVVVVKKTKATKKAGVAKSAKPAAAPKPKKTTAVKKGGSRKTGPTKKQAVKKPEPKKPEPKKVGLAFKLNGEVHTSLTAVVEAITGSPKNWSPKKLFGINPKEVKAGDVLERTFRGEAYRVEVIDE